MSELQIAQKLVQKKFKNKVDLGGHPYLEHLEYVSSHGRNEVEKVVGLLHDILEDTDITPKDLMTFGFSKDIIKKIELLTREKHIDYVSYIDHLVESKDENALFIKKIDLENNMDLSRIAITQEKDIDRVNFKYKPAYQKVCKALHDLHSYTNC